MLFAGRLRRLTGPLSVLGCALLGTLASCGGPSRPPADTPEIPGYLQLKERVGDYDFTPVRGRRIVVDPGHGGRFPGAVGPEGLTEASVNLGVALYLRGLLEWAGAEVWLTRTADHDLLTPADSSLTADLAARVALVDSLRPDVFVSIHHNSTASRDPDVNETQTYYPVGRDGPDLDLARAIHKHLVRILEITPAKIMAGNFHVIRESPVPAVLGEPAMISNPVIEGRLSLARSQELEATAYFLGLREYFAGGTPRLVAAGPDSVPLATGQPLTWTFDAGAAGSPGLDPQSVRLTVDGVAQPASVDPDGRTIRWYPRDLDRDGWHRVELAAANLGGRATEPTVVTVRGSRPQPWQLGFTYETAPVGFGEPRRVLIAWEGPRSAPRLPAMQLIVRPDTAATPVRSPLVIPLPPQPGWRGWSLQPADLLPPPGGTTAYALVDAAAATDAARLAVPATTAPTWRTVPAPWRLALLHCPPPWWPDVAVPGGAWRARQLPAGVPLGDLHDPTAPVVAVLPDEPFWLEAAGALPIIADAAHRTPWSTAAAPDSFVWEPLAPAVVGKLIVLDPTGGGTASDGAAPLGTRGADLNLQLARRCARLLDGLGAHTVLTREDETWVPAQQKILLANRRSADLFLTIQRGDDPAGGIGLRHHHGSRAGAAWAAATTAALQPLVAIGATVTTTPSYAYLLRHTACPALEINLPLPASAAAEELANTPAWQESQARALALGIVAQLGGPPPAAAVDLAAVITGGGAQMIPLARVDWAMLDGNLFWQPLAGNAVAQRSADTVGGPVSLSYHRTPGLPAAGQRHTLEIHAGPSWQLWALTRNSTGACAYRLLRENR